MFADDTTLYFDDYNQVFLDTLIKKELLNINKWFISNRLTLNIYKTCYMLFNNKLSHINISINNINLTRVKSTEFLGIIIDENLDWKLHILYLKIKLKKIIWMTNIISKFVNQKALLQVYNSILLPNINYCIILWSNTYKTNTLCINILQKKELFVLYIINLIFIILRIYLNSTIYYLSMT